MPTTTSCLRSHCLKEEVVVDKLHLVALDSEEAEAEVDSAEEDWAAVA